MGIITVLTDIQATLSSMGPIISTILIMTGGLAYGLAQTQPSDQRGKYINMAYALVAGGIVVAAVTAAAGLITQTSQTLLT